MTTKTINIRMPFPIIDFGRITYKHTKVKKLSVPGYILLVYIKRGEGERTLADNIAEAGIRGVMADVFNEELLGLIYNRDKKMVEYIGQKPENSHKFNQTLIHHSTREFRLTALGERLFRDQYVSDGGMRTERIQLYFNPAERTFDLNYNKLRDNNIANLFGTQIFEVNPGEVTSEMAVEFLNSIKEKVLKLEKQELVTEVENLELNQQIRPIHRDVRIDINSYGAAFLCNSSEYLEYLTKEYKSEWIDYRVAEESERLGIDNLQTIPIGNLGETVELILPKEIRKIDKAKGYPHLIWSESILNNRSLKAEVKDSLTLDSEQTRSLCLCISPLCVGTSLTENGELRAYEAIRLEIPKNGIYGKTIHLETLVERTIEGEIRHRYISDLCSMLIEKEWNQKNLKTELWLAGLDASGNHLNKFLESQFQRVAEPEKRIKMIREGLELNDSDLTEIIKGYAEDIWKETLQKVSIKDLARIISLAKDIATILNLDIDGMVSIIVAHLSEDYKEDDLLNVLLESGAVNELRAIELSHVVPSYIKRILNGNLIEGSHRITLMAKRIQVNLHKLCGMIGIQSDPLNYYPKKIEDIKEYERSLEALARDYHEFKKEYWSLSTKEDSDYLASYYIAIVEFNQGRAGEKDIDQYLREDFILLQEWSPKNCIIKLQTKLEIELRKKLNLNQDDQTSLYNMLGTALQKKIVNNEEYDQLQRLREVRNGLTHSDQADWTGLDIDEAVEIVFLIAEREPEVAVDRELTTGSQQLSSEIDKETESQIYTRKVAIKYPHKRKYLINTFQEKPDKAMWKLTQCEMSLLKTISGKNIDKQNMRIELNNARTKRIIPEEVAKVIVEFNKVLKDKERKLTNDDLEEFTRWVDAFWSLTSVELPS